MRNLAILAKALRLLAVSLGIVALHSCESGSLEDHSTIVPVTVRYQALQELSYNTNTSVVNFQGTITGSITTPNTSVMLHTNSSCSDLAIGQGTLAQFSTSGIDATVSSIALTDIYVQLNTDPGCYHLVQYDPNHNAPPPPVFSSTSPTSPSTITASPFVFGTTSGQAVQVLIYDDSACSHQVGSGSNTDFSTIGIQAFLQPGQNSFVYAKTVEPFGGKSACTLLCQYSNSATPIGAPTFSTITPVSPSNSSTTPTLTGTLPAAAASITFYGDSGCSNAIGSGTAAAYQGAGVSVTVSANSTTPIYAKGFDAQANPSACTYLTTFVADTVPPTAPAFASTNPASPSGSTIYPQVIGTASTDTVTVKLYSNAACTTQIGTGTRAQFVSTGITASATLNATTAIYAKAFDGAGNASSCAHLTDFVNNEIPPDAPTFGATTPLSPNNQSVTPLISGTLDADASGIRFFSDAACTTPIGSGTSAAFMGSGVQVTVPSNATTTIYAESVNVLGNVSGCTYMTDYSEATTPAADPTFVGTTPTSPANSSTTPSVIGSAPTSVVKINLYKDALCSTKIGSGTRLAFVAGGVTATVTANATTSIYAQAVDSYGNVSGCDFMTNYVHDNVLPSNPTFVSSSPASPTNATSSPLIKGTVSPNPSAGSILSATTVTLYDSGACSHVVGSGSVATFSGAGISASLSPNVPTSIYARSSDAAGNRSACTYLADFIDDTNPPGAPLFVSATPNSPSYSQQTTIVGTLDTNSDLVSATLVTLYSDAACVGALGSAAPGIFSTVGIQVTVPANATTPIYGQSTDVVGNVSSCAPLINFTHSNVGPSGMLTQLNLNGSVTVSWNADPNATNYVVKRATSASGPYTILDPGYVGTFYTDQTVSNGMTYYYVVDAQNSTGMTNDSTPASVSVSVGAPGVPTGLTATPQLSQVQLTWNSQSTDMSYSLYRANQTGGPYTQIASGLTSTGYLDTTVTNGTSYFYVVAGVNPAGTSAYSAEASAVPEPAPPAPLYLSAVPQGPGTSTMVFSWTAAKYANAVSSYSLQCGMASGSYTTTVVTQTATTYSWTYPLAQWGTDNPNFCVVYANWGNGKSVASNEVSFINMTAPILVANGGNGEVDLSWNQPDSYATDYRILRASTSGGPYTTVASSTSGGLTYQDTAGITNGKTYYYLVQALYSGAVPGQLSNEASATANPLQGTCNASDFCVPSNLALDGSSGTPVLNWSPALLNNGYNVYRASSLGGPYTAIATKVSSLSFSDVTPMTGMNYYYVTALWGLGETPASNIVYFRNGKVFSPAASPGSSQITLSWTGVSGANGYQISRGTASGGPYGTTYNVSASSTNYADTAVSNNTGYYYVISAKFSDGTQGQPSSEVSAMTTGSGVPGGLTVVQTNSTSIRVKWTAVSGATNYKVYSSLTSGGPYSLKSTGTSTTATISGLTSGTNYYFVVAAIVGGNQSAYSAEASGNTTATPPAPSLMVNGSNVTASWTALLHAVTYDLQRSTDGVNFTTVATGLTASAGTVTAPDSTIAANTMYFYRYQAVFSSGVRSVYSANSTPVTTSFVPSVPAPPTVIASSSSTVTLSWGAVPAAVTYNLKMSTTSGSGYVAVPGMPTGGTTATVSSLTPGTTYYFVVSALYSNLESANSSQISAVYLNPPAAPTALPGMNSISLTWSAASCGSPTYQIQRSTDGVNFQVVNTVATTSYTDTPLTSGQTYVYQYLTYCGGIPTLALSGVSSPVAPGVQPLAPATLSASLSGTTVALSWVQSPNVASYNLYRSTTSGGPYTQIATGLLTTNTTNSPGVGTYYYVVTSVGLTGLESANSNEVSVSLSLSAPSGLVANAVGSNISLSWSTVGGASTYTIKRGTASGGPYGVLSTQASNSYSDSAVQSGVTYYYVVTANSAGGSSSPNSTQASAVANGVNIQVPIELTDRALASGTSAQAFLRTQTSLNTTMYDGTVSYFFEVVATNTDSVSRSVQLIDSSSSVVASVSVPAGTTLATRLRTALVPDAGNMIYQVQLAGTSSASQLTVLSARMLVNQTNASKTRLYIPLLSSSSAASNGDTTASVASTSAGAYAPFSAASIYKRDPSVFSTLNAYNAWELETVVSAQSGAMGSVVLYDVTQGGAVGDTDAIFSGSSPTLTNSPFDEGITDFATANNGDQYQVSIACVSGGSGGSVSLYKAGLWVNISKLSQAEVIFRDTLGVTGIASTTDLMSERTQMDLSLFSNPSAAFQGTVALASGTNATLQLMNASTNDSGTSGLSLVSGSALAVSSTAKTWLRSSLGLSLTSGNRFVPEVVPTGGSVVNLTSSAIVIDLHR